MRHRNLLIMAAVLAISLTTGCGLTQRSADVKPLTEKDLETAFQAGKASTAGQLGTTEEREKAGRAIFSSYAITFREDDKGRAIRDIKSEAHLSSEAASVLVDKAEILAHQNQKMGMKAGEELTIPVGLEIRIGSVGGSSYDSAAGQIAALSGRDAVRAEGARAFVEADWTGRTLLAKRIGQNQVEFISATGEAVRGIIIDASPLASTARAVSQTIRVLRPDGRVTDERVEQPVLDLQPAAPAPLGLDDVDVR